MVVSVPKSELVNENEGQVNIGLSLDQPSCIPITIIAHPRVTSMFQATGRLKQLCIIGFVKMVYCYFSK